MHEERRVSGNRPAQASPRRDRFRPIRFLLALLLVAIILLSAAVVFHRTLLRAYAPSILQALSKEYRDLYDVGFSWDGYSISGISDFTITGVALTDLPTGSEFLKCDSMRIRTNQTALWLRGGDPSDSITSVELDNPVIAIGRKEGRWNTGKLFEPGALPRKKFLGRMGLVLHDGLVTWSGGYIVDGVPLRAVDLSRIEGSYRYERDGSMGFNLSGDLEGSGIARGKINIAGTYDPETLLIELTSTITNLDLQAGEEYAEQNSFAGLRGLADCELSVLIGPSAGEDYYSLLGKASIREGSVMYGPYGLQAERVEGDVQFSHKSIFSSGLSGVVNGSNVAVSGRIGDFENVTYNLTGDVSHAGIDVIGNIFHAGSSLPVDGSIDAHVEFSGTPEDFSIAAQAESPGMTAYGVPFELRNANVVFDDNKLRIDGIRATVSGGTAAGEGSVDFAAKGAPYGFHLTASGIDSSRLPGSFPFPVSGTIAANISGSGSTDSPPRLTGLIESSNTLIPQLPGLPSLKISAPVQYENGGIEIRGMSAVGDGVALLADGRIADNGAGKMSIAATLNDRSLLGHLTGFPVEGSLALAGDLDFGDGKGLAFDGDVVLNDLVVGGLSAQSVESHLGYSEGLLRLSRLDGIVGGAEIGGELAIPIAGSGPAAGGFTVSGLDIGPFVPPDLRSDISTSLDVAGTISSSGEEDRSLILNAVVREQGAKVGPNLVSIGPDGLALGLSLSSDFAKIESVDLDGLIQSREAGAPVYGGRVLTPYGERIYAEVTRLLNGTPAENLPATNVIIPTLRGSMVLAAHIENPLNYPDGNIHLNTTGLSIEGWDISSSTLDASGMDGGRWGVNLRASSGENGSIEVTGEIMSARTLPESVMALDATIRGSGLVEVFDFLGLSKFGQFAGSMDGSGRITGTFREPVVNDFHVDLSRSEAFGVPIDKGSISFGYQAPVLSLNELEVQGEQGFHAVGAGSIDLSSPSLAGASLVFNVDKLDLGYFAAIAGNPLPLKGIISGTLQLARDAMGPRVLYSASLENAGVDVGGEDMPLGLITLDAQTRPGKPQIDLSSLKLSRNGEEIDFSGVLPQKLVDMPSELVGLIDLNITSETGFTPPIPAGVVAAGVAWDGGLGPVHLRLKGAELSGDIGLNISNLRLGEITLVKQIKGILRASNSVITASPDEMKVTGEGWELGITGTANLVTLAAGVPGSVRFSAAPPQENDMKLSGPGLNLNLKIGVGDDAPSLRIDLPEGPSTGSDFLAGLSRLKATMTGKIGVLGGSIDLAKIAPLLLENAETPLTFNMGLDILGSVQMEWGTMFNIGSHIVLESGSLALTGPATDPVIQGKLSAPSGWLDFMGTHFVLIEPLEMEFSSFNKFEPHVTATAQGELKQVRSPDNFGADVTVTMRIDSQLSRMLDNMKLTSVPPLSQDELLAALAYEDIIVRTLGGSIFGNSFGAPGISDVGFEGLAYPIASSYLSQYIRRQAGLSDFEVSIDPEQHVYIYVEKEIFDNLVMYYNQTFGPDMDSYLLGSRYRWGPRSWVGLEIDNDRDITGQVQYIIPLD